MTIGRIMKACGFREEEITPAVMDQFSQALDAPIRDAMNRALVEDGEVFFMLGGDDVRTIDMQRILRDAGVNVVVIRDREVAGPMADDLFFDLPVKLERADALPPDLSYLRHDPTKNHRRRRRMRR